MDCKKKENKNSFCCNLKKIHNKVCKNKETDFSKITKGIFSLTSLDAGITITTYELAKVGYKKAFC